MCGVRPATCRGPISAMASSSWTAFTPGWVIERVALPTIRDRGALMSVEPASAGDAIPPKCEVIEVRVAELRQLFNAIDPSPFRERDLDPRAAEFIVDWSRDVPSDAPLALVVHLERAAGRRDEAV